MPKLIVMAGPNGAGKTTTSRLVLTGNRSVAEFVNADIIAAEQGLENLFNVFMPLADAWITLNNSVRGRPAKIAERDVGGPLRVYDQALWDELWRKYMKPTDGVREQAGASAQDFRMEDVYQAACRAVEEALARHKALGQSVVVWQNGEVTTLEPVEIAN